MNNRPPVQSLFSIKSREELDRLIKSRLGEGSLVDDMEKEESKKKKTQESRLLRWSDEWKKYPALYIFLGVSALFTMTLGMFMGIAPKVDLVNGTIFYHTDLMHLFLALVYMVAFPTVTELAFSIAKWLFHTRENNNNTQTLTMLAMMIIAGISIIGTGIAGGMVVASNIAFLSEFVEIPASAQKWVIAIIPVLLSVYAFLLTGYSLSSSAAKSERMLHQINHKADLDHATRQRGIMQIAEQELQVAELSIYLQMVGQGKMSAAEATAAIRAGRTLGQVEKRQGNDIDENGVIGTVGPQAPVFASQATYSAPQRPHSIQPPANTPIQARPSPNYTLDEFMDFQREYQGRPDFTVSELKSLFELQSSSNIAWFTFKREGAVPDDMLRQNFIDIYNAVMMSRFVPERLTITSGGNGNSPKP